SQALYRLLLSAIRTKFLSMDLESGMKLPTAEGSSAPKVDPYRQLELQHELADWAKREIAVAQQQTPVHRPPLETPPEWGTLDDLPQVEGFEGVTIERNEATGEIAVPHFEPQHAGIPGGIPGGFHGQSAAVLQVQDTYLVVETADGMAIIDQHALHERILYEHFRNRVLAGNVESQRLLIPESIELGPAEAAILVDHRETLSKLGLEIEDFGGNTVLLTRYPVMLARADRTALVKDVAERLMGAEQAPTRRDLLDDLLNMMACKAAIKAGQRLTQEEMESLLAQQHLVENAHHCPHGRPTILNLTRADLDRQFGRLG
ncbi:MAG: DNA mismatch repair protein MutL, partial [Planctomycetaceae bacterium]|nr:DNA mismatch repair protein MutL [Planctomycetaceae bacterium]